MFQPLLRTSILAILALVACSGRGAGVAQGQTDPVTLWRLPSGAIQPQAVVDSRGVVHLIYFKGSVTEGVGNLYYSRMPAGSTTPTTPIRVNSEADSAGSIGTVRTAQIAIGKDDEVHVVWNGLGPKGANGYPVAYQAYTRLNPARTAFEPQRNLITWAKGIDGGGSVAADRDGNVYVAWHALVAAKDEAGRAVYVAHSSDNGATFAREQRANPDPTGACGCCELKAAVDAKGDLYILYRAAGNHVDRDTRLLVSRDRAASFQSTLLQRWNINACPMSTYALADTGSRELAAWETRGHVYHAAVDPITLSFSTPTEAPGSNQKHPSIAADRDGRVLVAWTEGTGWQRGGALAWQLTGPDGAVLATGRKPGAVPVWGLATVCARPNAGFLLIY